MKKKLMNEYMDLRQKLHSYSAKQWAAGAGAKEEARMNRINNILVVRYGFYAALQF